LSTHDGEHTVHGELAPPDAVLELKLEADHVLLETLVELDAQDHPLNHEPVEWPLSTHDWELLERGAHALPHVDVELNLEAVSVLLATHVVHHVTEL